MMPRTYKTWEMIKALAENPKLKFSCGSHENANCVSIQNCVLCWRDGNPFVLNVYIPLSSSVESTTAGTIEEYEWEIVQEPVDFMTAIKAYAEDKTIICTLPGEKYIFDGSGYFNGGRRLNNSSWSITSKMIIEGKWYIEDE
jgi:hypothetical protein